MRPRLAVLCLALALAAPVLAYDTLADVRCACAEDAVNTGDYVSCFSKLSRRLVVKGVVSAQARNAAVARASHDDLDALSCDDAPAATGWGLDLALDSAFYSPGDTVGGRLELRNMTPNEVHLETPSCDLTIRIEDAAGRTVANRSSCIGLVRDLELPQGGTLVRDVDESLTAWDADPATGLANGATLPPGVYRVRGRVEWRGPARPTDAPIRPAAEAFVSFVIE